MPGRKTAILRDNSVVNFFRRPSIICCFCYSSSASVLSGRPEVEVGYYTRMLLIGDESCQLVLGQASARGWDLGVLALGV